MTTTTTSSFQVASLLPKADICPDCGREWPLRFGAHNCNFSRRYVHNKSIIVEPGVGLLETVRLFADRFESETCKSAEYAELGGDSSPYPRALADIDATIGFLKRFRSEMQELADHTHKWSNSDYCSICGADGRA